MGVPAVISTEEATLAVRWGLLLRMSRSKAVVLGMS